MIDHITLGGYLASIVASVFILLKVRSIKRNRHATMLGMLIVGYTLLAIWLLINRVIFRYYTEYSVAVRSSPVTMTIAVFTGTVSIIFALFLWDIIDGKNRN